MFFAVILRVEIHGCADVTMPQHALNRLRINLRLVHKPGAQAMTQVVKTEALPFRKNDPGALRRQPQMILYECRRSDGHLPVFDDRGEDKIVDFRIGALRSPLIQIRLFTHTSRFRARLQKSCGSQETDFISIGARIH